MRDTIPYVVWHRNTIESAYEAGAWFCETAFALHVQIAREFDRDEPVAWDFRPVRNAAELARRRCEPARSLEPQLIDGAFESLFNAMLDVIGEIEVRLAPTHSRGSDNLNGEPFSLWNVARAHSALSPSPGASAKSSDVSSLREDLEGRYAWSVGRALDQACEPALYAFLEGYVQKSRNFASAMGDAVVVNLARRLNLPTCVRHAPETWGMHRSPFAQGLGRNLEQIPVQAVTRLVLDERKRELRSGPAAIELKDREVFILRELVVAGSRGQTLTSYELVIKAATAQPPIRWRDDGVRRAYGGLRKKLASSDRLGRLVALSDGNDKRGYRVQSLVSSMEVQLSESQSFRIASGACGCEAIEDAYEFLRRLQPRQVFGVQVPA